MKKLILVALPLALLWGAHSAHAATAAPVAIDNNQVQQLQLALNATSLVLDQVELMIDQRTAMPNAASVSNDLSAMKSTLTGINATLAGTPGASAQHVAAKPTGQSLTQGNVASESTVQPQRASNEIAQAPASEPAASSDEYASKSGLLASISDTLKSKTFMWIVLVIVIILAIGAFLFFRRRRGPPAPAAPQATASPQTPAV